MKALTRTSIMVIAVAGLLALMAGTALAAPADMQMAQPQWNDGGLVNQLPQANEDLLNQVEPMIPQPDDGGQDDGQDTPGTDDGGQDTPGTDDGGQDTPGIDDGGQDGGDETVTPPASNNSGSQTPGTTITSKLPNTGTSLALLVAFALAIAGIAYVARRAASKRVR